VTPPSRTILGVVISGTLLAACGGIPIWPAPTESPSASATVAAAPGLPPPKAPDTSAASVLPPHVSTRAGVAVVAVGPIAFSVDDSGTRKFTSGGEIFTATHSLAKQLYGVPRLRPHADEGTVSTLAGAPVDASSPATLREIAELRGALTGELDGATGHALLESLGRKVDVEGLVVVAATSGGGTSARLVRVDVDADGGVKTHLDGAIFQATAGPPATAGDPPSYTWNATSIASLLGPPPTAAAPTPTPTTSGGEVGPRRDALSSSKAPAKAPAKAKPKKDEKKSKTIFESPWFWVAAGGVAAIGVTALVVSQTVNTQSGNIRIQGKVLP